MSSIIVIGNGPSVMENEYGEIIDAFDIVVRINQYRDIYSKYIGAKLSVFVTTDYNAGIVFGSKHNGYHNIVKNANNIIVWKDVNHKTLFDELSQTKIIQKNQKDTDKFINQDKIIDSLVHDHKFNRFHRGIWSSTGINILMYLIQTGEYDKIYIHGFDGLKNDQKVHYYENAIRTTHEHSPDKEIAFVEYYINKGIIIRLEDSNLVK